MRLGARVNSKKRTLLVERSTHSKREITGDSEEFDAP